MRLWADLKHTRKKERCTEEVLIAVQVVNPKLTTSTLRNMKSDDADVLLSGSDPIWKMINREDFVSKTRSQHQPACTCF